MSDMPEDRDDFKAGRGSPNKFWFAVYQNVFDHPIVGMQVQPPAAQDPKRKAAFPFMMWLWMCGEAAHREREVFIKGHAINLVRGQMVVAERFLAKKANWTRKAARLWLARLANNGMVRLSTVSRNGQLVLDFDCSKRGPGRGPTITVVTLCNYDIYQHDTRRKGTASGTARGPTGDRIPTSNNLTIDNTSNQSRKSPITTQDQSASVVPTGIDGTNVVKLHPTPPVDLPRYVMTDSTREKIEALDIDPEEMLDRLHERMDKPGPKVGSKSRYLITCAVNEAHEKTGTPIEVLKEIISGNRFAKQAAMVEVAVGKPKKAFDPRMNAQSSNSSALVKALKPR